MYLFRAFSTVENLSRLWYQGEGLNETPAMHQLNAASRKSIGLSPLGLKYNNGQTESKSHGVYGSARYHPPGRPIVRPEGYRSLPANVPLHLPILESTK